MNPAVAFKYGYNALAAATLIISLLGARTFGLILAAALAITAVLAAYVKHNDISHGYVYKEPWARFALLAFICMGLGLSHLAFVWMLVAIVKASVTLRSDY